MRPIIISVNLLLLTILPLSAQRCINLQNSSPDTMVSFLSSTHALKSNSDCVAFAINKLGEQAYASATPTLMNFLGFRWPAGAHQKQRLFVIEHDGGSIYPAAIALVQIGTSTLPAVLHAIKTLPMSGQELEVALSVWMMIYKGQAPTGVALLRQEAERTIIPREKSRLSWAAYAAARDWCDASNKTRCIAEAGNPTAAYKLSSPSSSLSQKWSN